MLANISIVSNQYFFIWSPPLWTTKDDDNLTDDGLRTVLTRRAKLAVLQETPRILSLGNGDQRSEKWQRCIYPTAHRGT